MDISSRRVRQVIHTVDRVIEIRTTLNSKAWKQHCGRTRETVLLRDVLGAICKTIFFFFSYRTQWPLSRSWARLAGERLGERQKHHRFCPYDDNNNNNIVRRYGRFCYQSTATIVFGSVFMCRNGSMCNVSTKSCFEKKNKTIVHIIFRRHADPSATCSRGVSVYVNTWDRKMDVGDSCHGTGMKLASVSTCV